MNTRLLPLLDRRAIVVTLLLSFASTGCDSSDATEPTGGTHWQRAGTGGSSGGSSSGVSPPPANGSWDAGTWWDAGKPAGDDAGPVGMPPPTTPASTAAECGVCHTTIYQQWQNSMHSHALTSPTVIVQTNEDVGTPLRDAPSPDPQKFCVNCHGPSQAPSTGAQMPPPASTHWKDGITCTSCHQFDGSPQKGSGGFATTYQGPSFQQGFVQGNTMLGAVDSPVGNSAHASNGSGQDFDPNPNVVCENCHEVWIDYDHDGIVEKGLDLALQTTWDEYKEYKTLGGKESCVSCHMPVVPGVTRIADGAQIPSQQYTQAPPRELHDHSFIGVDFALDTPAQDQATLAARTAMLQKAATFFIDRGSIFDSNDGVAFNVLVANTGTGHDLPSGFAFARQMWIEITATDGTGNVVFTSGVLGQPTDDLCDGEILFDFRNPMNRWIQGCGRQVDDELVTFQQKLVDLAGFQTDATDPFDPAGLTKAVEIGEETWMQFLHGGVVARQRPFDGASQVNLKAFEQREFQYDVPLSGVGRVHVQARLLFRQFPPYFLRALASAQSPSDPQIAPLVANLETIVMATDSFDF